MRETLVLTVVGPDRTGLVEALAARIAAHEGNWEASHMARMVGQFAGILQVTIDDARVADLVQALRSLDAGGLQVVAVPSHRSAAPVGVRARLDLTGDDRPGIVRDVSRVLTECGVNVEELQSQVTSAPMSGQLLFTARAVLHVPMQLTLSDLKAALEALASELMVDLTAEE